jgi:hypothetical protein
MYVARKGCCCCFQFHLPGISHLCLSLSPVFSFGANFVLLSNKKLAPKKIKNKKVKIPEFFLFVGEIHQILDIKF